MAEKVQSANRPAWPACRLFPNPLPAANGPSIMSISPMARPFPELAEIAGVRRGVANVGYKAGAVRADVTLLAFDPGTTVAGVTTRSRCPSPEVELCRRHLAGGKARA